MYVTAGSSFTALTAARSIGNAFAVGSGASRRNPMVENLRGNVRSGYVSHEDVSLLQQVPASTIGRTAADVVVGSFMM